MICILRCVFRQRGQPNWLANFSFWRFCLPSNEKAHIQPGLSDDKVQKCSSWRIGEVCFFFCFAAFNGSTAFLFLWASKISGKHFTAWFKWQLFALQTCSAACGLCTSLSPSVLRFNHNFFLFCFCKTAINKSSKENVIVVKKKKKSPLKAPIFKAKLQTLYVFALPVNSSVWVQEREGTGGSPPCESGSRPWSSYLRSVCVTFTPLTHEAAPYGADRHCVQSVTLTGLKEPFHPCSVHQQWAIF